jgi:hypothetical protein
MKLNLVKTGITLCVFYVALLFSSLASAEKIDVILEVDSTGGTDKLKVLENESPCNGTDTDPCITVESNTSPFIIFKLPDACEMGGPEYRLQNIRITMFNKVWPTPESPLNKKVAKDFKADPDTGIIDFSDFSKNKRTPEIVARHCDDSSDADDIYLDPEIRNRGTN